MGFKRDDNELIRLVVTVMALTIALCALIWLAQGT